MLLLGWGLQAPRELAAAPFGLAVAPAFDSLPPRQAGAVDTRAIKALPLLAQAGRPADSVIVTEAQDGRSLNLRRGELLQIVLGETAGTGYSWQIESVDRRLMRPEGQSIWQDPGPPPPPGSQGPQGLVGGPQQVSFLFRAFSSGEGELVLRHWRSWEGPRSMDRRFRLRLRVVE